MKKILKSGGYCSDGCQWNFCDYYKTEKILEPHSVLVRTKTNEFVIEPVYTYRHICTFFNNTELYNGSLNICNKIYGHHYEGTP